MLTNEPYCKVLPDNLYPYTSNKTVSIYGENVLMRSMMGMVSQSLWLFFFSRNIEWYKLQVCIFPSQLWLKIVILQIVPFYLPLITWQKPAPLLMLFYFRKGQRKLSLPIQTWSQSVWKGLHHCVLKWHLSLIPYLSVEFVKMESMSSSRTCLLTTDFFCQWREAIKRIINIELWMQLKSKQLKK